MNVFMSQRWQLLPNIICRDFFNDLGNGTVSGSPSIRCTFYGKNSAGSVRWYRDDEELMASDYQMSVTDEGRVYELSITEGLQSGGNYKCVSEDGREGVLNVKPHGNLFIFFYDNRICLHVCIFSNESM